MADWEEELTKIMESKMANMEKVSFIRSTKSELKVEMKIADLQENNIKLPFCPMDPETKRSLKTRHK